MRGEGDQDLEPYNPEIERTCRRLRQEARVRRTMENEQGNNPPCPIYDDDTKALEEFALPVLDGLNSSILRPPIEANSFKLRPTALN